MKRLAASTSSAIAALVLGSPAAADILVADFKTGFQFHDDRILRYNEKTGEYLGEFIPAGGPLDGPTAMTFGPDGRLYVASILITAGGSHSPNVIQYDGTTGAFQRVLIQVGSGGLCAPADLAFGPDGQLYISSGCDGVVLKFDRATGAPLGTFIGHSTSPPAGVNAPRGILFGPDDRVYVADYLDSTVRRFTLGGQPAPGFFDKGFGFSANAMGLALDPGGNKIYVALYGYDDIGVIDFATGEFEAFISVLDVSLGLFQGGPYALSFGPDGMLYCANHLDHAIIVINPHTRQIVRRLDPDNLAGLDRPAGILFIPEETCYPDCNGDDLLNLADFGCFQTKFALGDPYADCNGDTTFNLADFGCFQTQFALGCP